MTDTSREQGMSDIETLRERLAELAHEQWSGWMRYLYTRTMPCATGGDIIPMVWSERWQRQMATPYAELTEAEKESDRKEADRVLALLAHLSQPDSIEDMRARKDAAYEERNRMVALISRLWPSHLARHPDNDATWERDWMTIVCIHSPAGQLTWHVHDSHRHLFAHLSDGPNHWDGHTTEQKYERVASINAAPPDLRGLVEQWREEASRLHRDAEPYFSGEAEGMDGCADDLEAALAARKV